MVERARLFGVPTYRWLPAGAMLEARLQRYRLRRRLDLATRIRPCCHPRLRRRTRRD
jgi:hypothetical protein